jgi:hypothetical protein
MDDKENGTVEVTYTQEELDAMPPEQVNNIMLHAFKIEGKAVVRDKDGNIKYDDETLKGTYGEENLE